jgi:hypothetical protein
LGPLHAVYDRRLQGKIIAGCRETIHGCQLNVDS